MLTSLRGRGNHDNGRGIARPALVKIFASQNSSPLEYKLEAIALYLFNNKNKNQMQSRDAKYYKYGRKNLSGLLCGSICEISKIVFSTYITAGGNFFRMQQNDFVSPK